MLRGLFRGAKCPEPVTHRGDLLLDPSSSGEEFLLLRFGLSEPAALRPRAHCAGHRLACSRSGFVWDHRELPCGAFPGQRSSSFQRLTVAIKVSSAEVLVPGSDFQLGIQLWTQNCSRLMCGFCDPILAAFSSSQPEWLGGTEATGFEQGESGLGMDL